MSERPRLRPWLVDELENRKCERVGCNNQAAHQWNVCADKHNGATRYRRICIPCDVELNAIAMRFMFGQNAATEKKIKRYECTGVYEA